MLSVPDRRISILAAIALLCVFVTGSFAAAQQRHPTPTKSPKPYFEGFNKHCLRLPDNVIAALIARPEAGYARDVSRSKHPGDLNRFFCATRVQFSRRGNRDYLVSGRFPLTGADTGWFWIVSSSVQHPRVLLYAIGDAILPLTTRSKGYKDVESLWWSPSEKTTTLYRFNGVRYKRISSHTENRREVQRS